MINELSLVIAGGIIAAVTGIATQLMNLWITDRIAQRERKDRDLEYARDQKERLVTTISSFLDNITALLSEVQYVRLSSDPAERRNQQEEQWKPLLAQFQMLHTYMLITEYPSISDTYDRLLSQINDILDAESQDIKVSITRILDTIGTFRTHLNEYLLTTTRIAQ